MVTTNIPNKSKVTCYMLPKGSADMYALQREAKKKTKKNEQ